MSAGVLDPEPILLRWRAGGDLCTPFAELLPVSGVSISMFGSRGTHSTVCASSALASRLDEMQFRLGEGPRWETVRTGLAVHSTDLARNANPGWPTFSSGACSLGVGALFTFPITIGGVLIGAVDLYRLTPGTLRSTDSSRARALARMVAAPAVAQAVRTAEQHDSPEHARAPALRREVHQATGMILIQLDLTAEEALVLLKAHAFASDRALDDVASDVVARRLDFRDRGDQGPGYDETQR